MSDTEASQGLTDSSQNGNCNDVTEAIQDVEHALLARASLNPRAIMGNGATCTPANARSVARATALQSLKLHNARNVWQMCDALTEGSPQLRHLSFAKTKLTARDVTMLAFLLTRSSDAVPHLERLDLRGCGLAGAALGPLASALRSCATLASLHLDSNPLHDDGAIVLARVIREHSSLTTLTLASCSIGAPGAALLADSLKFSASLAGLALDDNPLGDLGAHEILRGVRSSSPLRRVTMANCRLGTAISNIVSSTNMEIWALQALSLRGNVLDQESARQLADALTSSTACALEELDLSVCKLDAASAVHAGQIITNCKNLRFFDLSHNPLGFSGISHVRQALEGRDSQVRLALHGCLLTELCVDKLIQALACFPSSDCSLRLSNNPLHHGGVSLLAREMKRECPHPRRVFDERIHSAQTRTASLQAEAPSSSGSAQLPAVASSPMPSAAQTYVLYGKAVGDTDREQTADWHASWSDPESSGNDGSPPVSTGRQGTAARGTHAPHGITDPSASRPQAPVQLPSSISECVSVLELASVKMELEGAIKLANALGSARNLRLLNVAKNDIPAAGLSVLVSALAGISPPSYERHSKHKHRGTSRDSDRVKNRYGEKRSRIHEKDLEQLSTKAAGARARALSLAELRQSEPAANLEKLVLDGNHAEREASIAITALIHRCDKLRELSVHNCHLSNKDGGRIADAVRFVNRPVRVSAKANWIGEATHRLFASVYAVQKAVEAFERGSTDKIFLDKSSVSAKSAAVLTRRLASNGRQVTDLTLGWNILGHQGATVIAALMVSETVTNSIHLPRNGIDDQGAMALAAALREDTTLRELDLSSNRIADMGLDAIYSALLKNTTLHAITLRGNPADGEKIAKCEILADLARINRRDAIPRIGSTAVNLWLNDRENFYPHIGMSQASARNARFQCALSRRATIGSAEAPERPAASERTGATAGTVAVADKSRAAATQRPMPRPARAGGDSVRHPVREHNRPLVVTRRQTMASIAESRDLEEEASAHPFASPPDGSQDLGRPQSVAYRSVFQRSGGSPRVPQTSHANVPRRIDQHHALESPSEPRNTTASSVREDIAPVASAAASALPGATRGAAPAALRPHVASATISIEVAEPAMAPSFASSIGQTRVSRIVAIEDPSDSPPYLATMRARSSPRDPAVTTGPTAAEAPRTQKQETPPMRQPVDIPMF